MTYKPLERTDYMLILGVAAVIAVYVIMRRQFPVS